MPRLLNILRDALVPRYALAIVLLVVVAVIYRRAVEVVQRSTRLLGGRAYRRVAQLERQEPRREPGATRRLFPSETLPATRAPVLEAIGEDAPAVVGEGEQDR